jgi:hypothetical protein
MRHHLTRRKGHDHLKNKKRTTHRRRRQRGGAVITSAADWFKAVSDFESRKGEFGPNYTIASLSDSDLTLPQNIPEQDEANYVIHNINVSYPPLLPLPADYKAPAPVDMNLIDIAQMVTYLFNGENIGEGLLNQGSNTLSTFIQYVNSIKNISDNTESAEGYENKRTIWFLNEIETALQQESGANRGFTSIYDTPKFPFYIMYLAANPVKLPDRPVLEAVDPSMLPMQ